MKQRWRGIIPGLRLQKWLCKLLLKSRFLKSRVPRRPIAADLTQGWKEDDWWKYREDWHRKGQNTYTLFLDEVPIENKWVLDIGCGDGVLSTFYAQAGALKVIGCDPKDQPLRAAKSYVAKKGLSARVLFIQGDAAELPFGDSSFDLIISNDTCEHILGLEQTLHDCYRVAKPGGHVCLKFTPWFHPAGFHLMNYIYIPYAHLFFGEQALLEILLEMAAENQKVADSLPGLKKTPPPTSFVEMGMSPLNKVTIGQFQQMLRRTDFEIKHFRLMSFRRNARNRLIGSSLEWATKVPWLNEFLTSHLACILEKPK